MFNRFPKRGKQKKKTIMKKNANEIFMLQYRIKRYQAMGNRNYVPNFKRQTAKLLAKASCHDHVNTPLNKMNGAGNFHFLPSSFTSLLPIQDNRML